VPGDSNRPRGFTVRVLVAGATGYIGSAVVRELLEAGHQVVGLARSDTAAAALSAAGVDVHRGDLDDLDGLRAVAADGVIFAASKHISDTADSAARAKVELNAVEAIGSELEGTSKPFAVTSTLIGIARPTGVSAFVGDGSNRWPSVHRRDAATPYRLAVESAPPGARLHAVAEDPALIPDLEEGHYFNDQNAPAHGHHHRRRCPPGTGTGRRVPARPDHQRTIRRRAARGRRPAGRRRLPRRLDQ
jgi:hypothetical protein